MIKLILPLTESISKSSIADDLATISPDTVSMSSSLTLILSIVKSADTILISTSSNKRDSGNSTVSDFSKFEKRNFPDLANLICNVSSST